MNKRQSKKVQQRNTLLNISGTKSYTEYRKEMEKKWLEKKKIFGIKMGRWRNMNKEILRCNLS